MDHGGLEPCIMMRSSNESCLVLPDFGLGCAFDFQRCWSSLWLVWSLWSLWSFWAGRPLLDNKTRVQKADSTLRSSRAVPHPSTNRALRRLTSEFGRDPVHSTRYGRWRHLSGAGCVHMMGLLLKAVPWCRRATQEMAFISQAVALTLGHDPTCVEGCG